MRKTYVIATGSIARREQYVAFALICCYDDYKKSGFIYDHLSDLDRSECDKSAMKTHMCLPVELAGCFFA